MERLSIDVVENATKIVNIMPETPLDKVVADCRNTDKPIDWIDIIAWQPLPEPYYPKGE